MDFRDNLYTPHKLAYVKGEDGRFDDGCILCAVAEGDKRLTNLIVAESKSLIVTLNLYPYNPGHLMIFPRRHIEDIREYSDAEWDELRDMQNVAMDVLTDGYSPQGFNIGYNIGQSSGASIAHVHLHIVPRYRNELGVIDILSGAKILVEDPSQTRLNLIELFEKYLYEK